MKKLFISGFALAGMLCVAGGALSINDAVETKAENYASSVAALLSPYITNGTYTKKTQIFANSAAITDMEEMFHAGETRLERTTYYSETANALLMGDYDGGFDDINSGYAADAGKTNMNHIRFTGDASDSNQFFNSEYHQTTYTVASTTPNAYFVNLSTLFADINGMTDDGAWTVGSDGSYYHNFSDLSLDDKGHYNDTILKDFQYFIAPMLLQGQYFSYSYIRVKQTANWLSLRFYITSDLGKVTVHNETEGLLAEARVFKGLWLVEPTCVMRGDWDNNTSTAWTDVSFEYAATMNELEQYELTATLFLGMNFGVSYYDGDSTEWFGYSALGTTSYFGQSGEGNIYTTLPKRSYTFYWKGGTELKLYPVINSVSSYNFSIHLPDGWYDADNSITKTWLYVYYDDNTKNATWPGVLIGTNETDITVSVEGEYWLYAILVRRDESSDRGQTANIPLPYCDNEITINSMTWTDGKVSDYTVTELTA